MTKPRVWKNHNEEQVAHPKFISAIQIETRFPEIIREAITKKHKVKAVGSGHSWSDVCLTDGFLIEPNRLNKVLRLDKTVLKSRVNTKKLVHVQSGIKIKDLNEYLDKKMLSLSNMGGYDGQTIVGATATSTHGSGIKHGPLCDMIRSVEVFAGDGEKYRIEPKGGITNKTIFKQKYPGTILVQDDDWFYSVIVSVGCLGIISSVIIELTKKRNLKEVRTLSDWESAKFRLTKGDIINKFEHYELLLNPYKTKGPRGPQNSVIETVRTKYNGPLNKVRSRFKKRDFWSELASKVASKGDVHKLLTKFNNEAPKLIDNVLNGFKDDVYINKSYKVYNIGNANHIPSLSAEIALPLEGDKYIKGIEKLLETYEKFTTNGHFLSGTVAVRFVKKSKAYLSPMYERDTCMLEIITLKNSPNAMVIYKSLEKALRPFGAKMHWGQINSLSKAQVEKDYPKLPEWKAVARKLNKHGVFNNKFSDRAGLSI